MFGVIVMRIAEGGPEPGSGKCEHFLHSYCSILPVDRQGAEEKLQFPKCLAAAGDLREGVVNSS